MRVFRGARDIVDRADRDAGGGHRIYRLLDRARLEPLGYGTVYQVGVVGLAGAGGEAWVFDPFLFADGAADATPHVARSGCDVHPAVVALVGVAGGARSTASIAPPAVVLAGAQVGGDRYFGQRVAGVGEADVYVLALAGTVPLVESGQDADCGVQGGHAVNDRKVGARGRRLREAGEGHMAADGLPDGVEAGPVLVGAVLPVGRDVGHDDPGVQGLQHVITEAHVGDDPGAEVLDHDVG